MKIFRKIFLLVMAVTIVGSVALCADAYIKGDTALVEHYALVAGTAAVAPILPFAGAGLGLFSPGLEALNRASGRFSVQSQSEAKNMLGQDYTLYIRKEITSGAGLRKLIEASTTKVDGVTNFDGNTLKGGENFAIEAIAIRQGSHATITAPQNIINYTNVSGSVEVEFRSASLIIAQDNKELVRLPFASLLNQGAGLRTVQEEAYKLVNCPVLIEGRPIDIMIEFAQGATMAAISTSTSKFHIEVQLLGKMTGKKAV